MIYKLPRWVWLGGAVLAFIAGMINAVGLLGFQHQAVSHLTGTTSMVGLAIANFNAAQFLHFTAVLLSFLLGAVLSGFIVQDNTLKLGRRYGAALLLESALLFLAVPLLNHTNGWGDCLASCACGLQNAMASTYSGTVIRTTHVSGMFTDIGISLGHLLRRLPVETRRLWLSTLLILTFLAGGVGGALAFQHFRYEALYFPATLTGLAGLGYSLYQFLRGR